MLSVMKDDEWVRIVYNYEFNLCESCDNKIMQAVNQSKKKYYSHLSVNYINFFFLIVIDWWRFKNLQCSQRKGKMKSALNIMKKKMLFVTTYQRLIKRRWNWGGGGRGKRIFRKERERERKDGGDEWEMHSLFKREIFILFF